MGFLESLKGGKTEVVGTRGVGAGRERDRQRDRQAGRQADRQADIIMEICKAPTLRLKALNKHTHIMYIEMENI